MNSKGKVVIQPHYDAIGKFKEYGYAVMQRNNRVGLVNKYGIEVIAPNVFTNALYKSYEERDEYFNNQLRKVELQLKEERIR